MKFESHDEYIKRLEKTSDKLDTAILVVNILIVIASIYLLFLCIFALWRYLS
jgi:hypothetical protein